MINALRRSEVDQISQNFGSERSDLVINALRRSEVDQASRIILSSSTRSDQRLTAIRGRSGSQSATLTQANRIVINALRRSEVDQTRLRGEEVNYLRDQRLTAIRGRSVHRERDY